LVGEIAEDRRSEEAGGERTAEQNTEFGSAQAPFVDEASPGEGRGAEIVAVRHHDEKGQDQQADVETRDHLAVQNLGDIDDRLAHRSPLLEYRLLTRKYLPPLLATGWFAYPEPTFHRWPLALLKICAFCALPTRRHQYPALYVVPLPPTRPGAK